MYPDPQQPTPPVGGPEYQPGRADPLHQPGPTYPHGYPDPGYQVGGYPGYSDQGYPGQGYPAYPGQGYPTYPVAKRRAGRGKIIIVTAAITVVTVGLLCTGAAALVNATKKNAAPSPSGQSSSAPAIGAPSGTPSGVDPFAGTPAALFPQGAAGLVLPTATAVTGFTRAQVGAALTTVRQLLIAGRLDNTMLVDHDGSRLLGLMAPDARAGIQKDFGHTDLFTYATELAAGTRLVAQPRVRGATTFAAGIDSQGLHELQITTNYVWVYPFAGPNKDPADNLVIVHDQITWGMPSPSEVAAGSQGIWIDQAQAFGSNIDCTLLDQGLIGSGAQQPGATGSEDPDALFDPGHALDITNNC